jgi:hypothetical protein
MELLLGRLVLTAEFRIELREPLLEALLAALSAGLRRPWRAADKLSSSA